MADTKKFEENHTVPACMSARDFAHLGGGEISYVRELTKAEAGKLFPEVRDLDDFPHGLPLFALHAADGSPIALADSKSAAEAQADEDNLLMMPVH